MAFVTLALAAAFGAGDQYLGSMSWHPWAADVSLLSAPWLLLAFLAGWAQRDPRHAALLGLAATYAALAGYGLMTLSPFEHARLTTATLRGFVVSEAAVLAGGIVTGPLFGWLGHLWRTRRAWAGALAIAASLTLEPLARSFVAGHEIRFRLVSTAEVAVGIATALYVATARRA